MAPEVWGHCIPYDERSDIYRSPGPDPQLCNDPG
jgi:hypothetical protein